MTTQNSIHAHLHHKIKCCTRSLLMWWLTEAYSVTQQLELVSLSQSELVSEGARGNAGSPALLTLPSATGEAKRWQEDSLNWVKGNACPTLVKLIKCLHSVSWNKYLWIQGALNSDYCMLDFKKQTSLIEGTVLVFLLFWFFLTISNGFTPNHQPLLFHMKMSCKSWCSWDNWTKSSVTVSRQLISLILQNMVRE